MDVRYYKIDKYGRTLLLALDHVDDNRARAMARSGRNPHEIDRLIRTVSDDLPLNPLNNIKLGQS